MTVNTSPTNIAPAADTSVDSGSSIEASTNSAVESSKGDSNNVESFSDWLKRQATDSKKETSDKKDEKNASIKQRTKEDEDTSNKSKHDDKVSRSSDRETREEAKEEVQEQKAQKYKIKEKEYEAAELEKIIGEHSERSSKVQEYERQFEEINSNIEKLVNAIKTNPRDIFDRMEIPREVIEKYYFEKYVEPGTLTAEQKLERYEKAEKERAEKAAIEEKTSKERAETSHFIGKWEQQLKGALEEAKLPQTEWVVSRMAGYMKQAMDKKLMHLNPSDVVKFVKDDLKALQKATLDNLDPEQLADTLGEDVLNKIRERETKKFSPDKFENKQSGVVKKEEKSKERRRVSNIYDLLD